MYKYKLKEIEVGDTEIRKGVKSTVTDIDPETGGITWDVASAADFTTTYKALQQARQFLDTLEKTGKAKDDITIDKFAEDIAKLFNAFRTHVRKNYPKEYERVLRLKEVVVSDNESPSLKAKIYAEDMMRQYRKMYRIVDGNFGSEAAEEFKNIVKSKISQLQEDYNPDEEQKRDEEEIFMPMDDDGRPLGEQSATSQGGASFTPGEGAQYATPFAFRKKGKKGPSIYYYKLGYKPVPKIKPKSYDIKKLFEYNDFQEGRIRNFDAIEDKINSILPMISNAKNKTAEFYNENPGSYSINYPTDAILKELDDIIDQLKQANEDLSKSV